jgi:hypothetical protein
MFEKTIPNSASIPTINRGISNERNHNNNKKSSTHRVLREREKNPHS